MNIKQAFFLVVIGVSFTGHAMDTSSEYKQSLLFDWKKNHKKANLGDVDAMRDRVVHYLAEIETGSRGKEGRTCVKMAVKWLVRIALMEENFDVLAIVKKVHVSARRVSPLFTKYFIVQKIQKIKPEQVNWVNVKKTIKEVCDPEQENDTTKSELVCVDTKKQDLSGSLMNWFYTTKNNDCSEEKVCDSKQKNDTTKSELVYVDAKKQDLSGSLADWFDKTRNNGCSDQDITSIISIFSLGYHKAFKHLPLSYYKKYKTDNLGFIQNLSEIFHKHAQRFVGPGKSISDHIYSLAYADLKGFLDSTEQLDSQQ